MIFRYEEQNQDAIIENRMNLQTIVYMYGTNDSIVALSTRFGAKV